MALAAAYDVALAESVAVSAKTSSAAIAEPLVWRLPAAGKSRSGRVVTNNMDFPFSQQGPMDNVGHVSWWPSEFASDGNGKELWQPIFRERLQSVPIRGYQLP
jgi:hypothetical protein